MKAEIITIGDEILIGQIINTNSVWMAQELNKIGVSVLHMSSISDDNSAIINAMNIAASRVNIVFITGGLGPTKDDVTKMAFATFFNVELIEDINVLQQVSTFFIARGKKMSSINTAQALVPKGCIVINNNNGTAPGMWMEKNKVSFISMPGVPYEMKAMMADFVLPKIKNDFTLPFIYHKTVLTQGIGESALAEIINDWEDSLSTKNIKLAYLPKPGMVRLRLSCTGENKTELEQKVNVEVIKLKNLLPAFVYGEENYGEEMLTIEKLVSENLRNKNQTLALAESCTGGYLASLFTALPGASDIFKGSITCYSNDAKQKLLHVDEKIIETHGAVSKECVEKLAENVRELFNADYSIAISGIAGPTGGTNEKPVGLVWIAVSKNDKQFTKMFQFGTNRERNIIMAANAGMNLLREFMLS
jgi:nicotinamide-nucleotide amidase